MTTETDSTNSTTPTKRERPIATKEDPTTKTPSREVRIGDVVIFRAPGGGMTPMIVDRVDTPSIIGGLAMCSRVNPPFSPVARVPYSREATPSLASWCYLAEATAPARAV